MLGCFFSKQTNDKEFFIFFKYLFVVGANYVVLYRKLLGYLIILNFSEHLEI